MVRPHQSLASALCVRLRRIGGVGFVQPRGGDIYVSGMQVDARFCKKSKGCWSGIGEEQSFVYLMPICRLLAAAGSDGNHMQGTQFSPAGIWMRRWLI